MKVFLKVAVDVSAIQDDDKKIGREQIKDSVEEAIYNAIAYAQDAGHSHELSGHISILLDYVAVTDSDMEDKL